MDKILDEIIEELYQAKLGSLKTKPIRTGDYRVGLTKAIDIIEKHKNNVDFADVVGRSEQLPCGDCKSMEYDIDGIRYFKCRTCGKPMK